MAEETHKKAAASEPATDEVVVVSDVPEAEEPSVVEKEAPPPAPEPEPEAASEKLAAVVEEVVEAKGDEEKITESASFKEETNVAGELPDPQKKALDELKLLVQEALKKHEFTAPPPPPPEKEEEKPAEEAAPPAEKEEEVKEKATEEEQKPEAKTEVLGGPQGGVVGEEPPKPEPEAAVPRAPVSEEEESTPVPRAPVSEGEPLKSEPEVSPAPEQVVVAEVVETVTAAVTVDDDGAKTVEAIEETIVAVAAVPAPPPPAEEEPSATVEAVPPPPPEEVSIWGIPLLADERTDVILLKFLRARDFKVKEAFTMLKNTVKWRKEFGIETLLEEDLGTELEKVVFMDGFDKEGHPVCYNVYGEFNSKELYLNTFSDEEKRQRFLRWRIQFLEKSIRKLDFSPDGICSFAQINDLKNSPGPFKRELRTATNQALLLLQDNYPEFLAKQVFINVPWWYLAFYRMISPFFTQRTKSKFVFAGPSKSAETLFKYIAPEQVPVQYGGLSREGEFTTTDAATEEIIKPATKHTVEFPVSEACTLVWEVRAVGWEVYYGAEFTPETGYTVIIQKSRKISASEETVISDSFKVGEPGKVVLTFDNQTSKKKKLLFRSKIKPFE
ncbi:hypothetical protein C3L33_13201, partial [Rhododendron williamsianum]